MTIGDRAFAHCDHEDLSIDVPETVQKVRSRAFEGCKIRLPTSLKLLSEFKYGLSTFDQVKSVAISSKVNLNKLLHFVSKIHYAFLNKETLTYPNRNLSEKPFLNPDMKFRVLHSLSSVALPPMNLHIHESFFSVDFTLDELKSFHNDHKGLLSARVKFEFEKTVSTYAAVLRCKRRELPEPILYKILPFLGGDSLPEAMLKEIVAEVGKEMKKPVNLRETVKTSQ